MISPKTSCFYMVEVEGEAAQAISGDISPSTASDFVTGVLTSADFEVDIMGVHSMDQTVATLKKHSPSLAELKSTEQYNPLYIPGPQDQVDEMLNLDTRTDGIRFVGMNGNPFTLKLIEVSEEGAAGIAAKLDYRPFEFPAYPEIVASRETTRLN